MAWNEPGGNSNNQDPWGGKRPKNGDRKGPPDLDEAFRKLQESLNGLFGGGKKRTGGSGSDGGSNGKGAGYGAPTNATECLSQRHGRFARLLLQSVFFDEFQRLHPFAADQAIELGSRQAYVQQTGYLIVMLFLLHNSQFEELCTQSSRSEERRVGKECRSRWSPYH